jgi:hypothetical protein
MIAAAGRYSAGMRWERFSSALRTGFDGFKSSDRTSVTFKSAIWPYLSGSRLGDLPPPATRESHRLGI